MKASELIEKLQRAIEEHGDLEVMIQDSEYGDADVDDVDFNKYSSYLYLW